MRVVAVGLIVISAGFGAGTAEGAARFQNVRSFKAPPLGPNELVRGSDGALYGTTREGGPVAGAVFNINADGSGFRTLHNFVWDGFYPAGALVSAGGVLYGVTNMGGFW